MKLISRLTSAFGRVLTLGAFAVALAGPVVGQCVMCRESAKYQRGEALIALNRGILILAVPPVAIALGIGWVTYRHRNSSRLEPRNQQTPSDL